jgi:Skp family chaperone for outer membrane proteins
MEHPLVGELSHLTTDELSAKISELNKKLSIAARTGNAHLCNQLRMALESYNTKYQEKLQQSYRDASNNFDDKINIQ